MQTHHDLPLPHAATPSLPCLYICTLADEDRWQACAEKWAQQGPFRPQALQCKYVKTFNEQQSIAPSLREGPESLMV